MAAGDTFVGRRLPDGPVDNRIPAPGEYVKDADGVWWASVPPPLDLLACLRKHEVTEHEEGTITVSPSILVTGAEGMQWHGYLERGVWRDEHDSIDNGSIRLRGRSLGADAA